MHRTLLPLCLLFSFSACDGGGDGGSGDGDGAGDGDGSGGGIVGDGDGDGDTPGTGGTSGDEIEFEDLVGRIRFANFVSDGEAGLNFDLYWGGSLDQSEFVQTIEYGEVTEFFVPRRPVDAIISPLLDEDEARYFMVFEGDSTGTPVNFPVMTDESFTEETTITVALAHGGETDQVVVSSQKIDEHELPIPPDDESYVYGWSNSYDEISEGDFVFPASDSLCDPETVGATGNVGQAFVFPPGSTGLYLVDVNTECATGSSPAEGTTEGGVSYVLLGKADTFELDAREAILLELTVGE